MPDNTGKILTAYREKEIRRFDTGYAVVKYCVVDGCDEDTITAVGYNLPDTDAAVTLTGEFQDSKYGRQFQVKDACIKPPDNQEEFVRYVSSLGVGFGRKRAIKLYELCGHEIWKRLESGDLPPQAKRIAGEARLNDLIEKVRETEAERDLIRLIGNKVSVDVGELRRANVTANTIRSNPYYLCKFGPAFHAVDEFALTEGFAAPDNEKRIECALHEALKSAELRGSTCLPGTILLFGDRARGIDGALPMLNRKGNFVTEQMCRDALKTAVEAKRIKLNSGHFYTKESLWEEWFIAKKLTEMLKADKKEVDDATYRSAVQEYEKAEGIELSGEQREAILGARKNSVMIVTGYPGAGKTTMIKALLHVFSKAEGVTKDDVLLLSPTGRAARRMEEATGYTAFTVLSALSYNGRNKDDIIKSDWKLDYKKIIIDEESMTDLAQQAMLLRHVDQSSQLIMIGDPDQLPSVGAGNVLHDLIRSRAIPVFRLLTIFRQKSGGHDNPIPINAEKIRNGRTDLQWVKTPESAFVFYPRTGDETIFQTAVKLYKGIINKTDLTVDDVALLVPFRKKSGYTMLSAYMFNHVIQQEINPIGERERTMTAHGVTFHGGDKVMQLVNTENAKNGDIGYIEGIDYSRVSQDSDKFELVANVKFNDDVVQYAMKDLANLDLAYASSVHKMQGSEVDTVLLVIAGVHSPLLARNLIYTAVTRAINHVVVIGEEEALKKAILRDNTKDPAARRITLLGDRLHYEAEKTQN